MQARFVGNYAEVGEKLLDTFGQPLELTPEAFAELREIIPILSAEAFAGFGFTAEELKRYGSAAQRQGAPADVLARVQQAIALWASGQDTKNPATPAEMEG